jgi:hypothetical protein
MIAMKSTLGRLLRFTGAGNVALVTILVHMYSISFAQDNLKIQAKEPAYFNINQADASKTFNVYDGDVNLEYLDNVGSAASISLRFYNWKSELQGIYTLDKTLGSNHYSFNLEDIGLEVKDNEVYRCEFTDERKTKYEWNIRCAVKPADNLPSPSISVKPLQVACKDDLEDGNLIEFYGSVTGGRAPFVLQWYTLNEARTEFLHQPNEVQMADAAAVSMIRIDKDPVYNVMLLVTDACGNIGKQMVRVSCNAKKKKINSIFVEPLVNMQTLSPLK